MSVEPKKLTKRLSKNISITPEFIQQYIKFSSFSTNSEQIVNFLIEKLISYTVTKSEKNKVEAQLPEVCFNFITDTIDTFIEQQFIAVDKMDNIEGNNIIKEPDNNELEDNQNINNNNLLPENIDNISLHKKDSSIDMNKKLENNNNENNNIMNEHNNLENNIDFSQISNIESQQNNKNNNNANIYFNNYIHGENFWSVIDEPENSEKDRFISATLFPFLPEETEFNIVNNKITAKKSLEKVEEEDDNNLIESNIKIATEQLKNIQSNSNIEKKEENNKTSSKIIQDEKKEENKNKNKTKNEISLKKKKKNLFEIMNEFPFYDLPKEEQMSEINKEGIDYVTLREEKELEKKKIEDEEKKKLRLKREEMQKIKEEVDKKKAYQNKKLTVDVNGKIVFIKEVNLDSLNKEFNTIKSNLKQLTKTKALEPPPRKFSIYYNPVDKEKDKEKNQNNSNTKTNRTNKFINPEDMFNAKVISNNNNNGLFKLPPIKSEIEKKLERGPITPAGSNFDLIQMEIGVSLKEDEKYKTGGKNFFQKFNKYSLDTYNSKLKDSIIYNSIDAIKNKLGLTTSVDFHNNLTETYSNFGNQLGNTNTSLFKKNNLKTTNNFNIPTNQLNSTLNPEISIKGKFSLSNAFNQLDLLPDYKLNEMNQNRKNIFKSKDNKKNKNNGNNLNEINQFAATLLGVSWGNSSMNQRKLNPIKKPKKPLYNEIQKEMGMTGRNLRERNKAQNYMSRSVAMNFFQP
jgi:hypothetical protein